MKKIKDWFKDKWAWLLTFNHPPEITIRGVDIEIMSFKNEVPLKVEGRALLRIEACVLKSWTAESKAKSKAKRDEITD